MGNIKINIKIVIIFLEERNGFNLFLTKKKHFREERYENFWLKMKKKREKKTLVTQKFSLKLKTSQHA